jgi:uncharacterized protein
MLYNVAQLLKSHIGASRQHTLEGELCDIDDLNPGGTPVEGYLTMIRTPKGVLVTGQASLSLNQRCRRCLEPFRTQVTIEVEEEFIPSIDITTGASLPITEEDDPDLVIDEHHVLDVTPLLNQYIISESLNPGICRPDCKGICPNCGQDLNVGPCGCQTDSVDPRLAALAALLGPDDQKE